MQVNGALLALLTFMLFAAVFASDNSFEYSYMAANNMKHKAVPRFIWMAYLPVLWSLLVCAIARQGMQNKKSKFLSRYMECTVFPKKIMLGLLDDCKFSKYCTATEMTGKDRYSILYQIRQEAKQNVTVYPLSLQRYFADRQKNGNTADLMKYEWARYRTFSNFPQGSPARPTRLAANGFYYCGSGEDDSVCCFSCKRVYRGFKEGDIVSDIHYQISPSCPFLIGVDTSNVGIHSDEKNPVAGAEGTTEEKDGEYAQKAHGGSYGDATLKSRNYRYPDYENIQYRLDTFYNWPYSDTLQPSVLADAGYFYAGFGDCVRCFSCGGGLRNWEYGDGPWEEHERWFPHCTYLKERLTERRMKSRETLKMNTDITNSDAYTYENKTKIDNNDPITGQSNTIFKENEKLKNQLTCKICMDEASNVVFIPCGHMVSCQTCAPLIRKCAICRKLIEGRVKAFMS